MTDAERKFSRYIIHVGDDYRYTGIVPDTVQSTVQFPDSSNISPKETLNIIFGIIWFIYRLYRDLNW